MKSKPEYRHVFGSARMLYRALHTLSTQKYRLPVRRYVHPDTFRMFAREAAAMGFTHAAVGAMVRSSYHADQQAHAAGVADAMRERS